MSDIERVKDLVGAMTDALLAQSDYTTSELISACATLFSSVARTIMEKSPESTDGILAIIQHMQFSLTPVTTKTVIH